MVTKLASEFFGSASLLAIIVGSGVMGEQLAQGNIAIALLANSLATGCGLFVLIQSLVPISGAHFNPIVSLSECIQGRLSKKELGLFVTCQSLGAILGVWVSHGMFDLALFQISSKPRSSIGLHFSEGIATMGLLAVIYLSNKRKPEAAPFTIAAYITSAYWFTSSTSFANPSVTLARMLTDTFCGIAPNSVLPFVLSQLCGAGCVLILSLLFKL